MKKRLSEEQIIGFLREAGAGMPMKARVREDRYGSKVTAGLVTNRWLMSRVSCAP